MKNKKQIFGLLGILILTLAIMINVNAVIIENRSGYLFVSNSTYQHFAGDVIADVSIWPPLTYFNATFDDNFSTFGDVGIDQGSNLTFNYILDPSWGTPKFWEVFYWNNSISVIEGRNLTIPQICIDYDSNNLHIMIRMQGLGAASYLTFLCRYENSFSEFLADGWTIIDNITIGFNPRIYEEGMYFLQNPYDANFILTDCNSGQKIWDAVCYLQDSSGSVDIAYPFIKPYALGECEFNNKPSGTYKFYARKTSGENISLWVDLTEDKTGGKSLGVCLVGGAANTSQNCDQYIKMLDYDTYEYGGNSGAAGIQMKLKLIANCPMEELGAEYYRTADATGLIHFIGICGDYELTFVNDSQYWFWQGETFSSQNKKQFYMRGQYQGSTDSFYFKKFNQAFTKYFYVRGFPFWSNVTKFESVLLQNASVSVYAQDTNQYFNCITNSDGNCNITLTPGTYTITTTHINYTTDTISNILWTYPDASGMWSMYLYPNQNLSSVNFLVWGNVTFQNSTLKQLRVNLNCLYNQYVTYTNDNGYYYFNFTTNKYPQLCDIDVAPTQTYYFPELATFTITDYQIIYRYNIQAIAENYLCDLGICIINSQIPVAEIGHLVEGSSITITSNTSYHDSFVTDSGCFKVLGIGEGEYNITAQKNGFTSNIKTLDLAYNNLLACQVYGEQYIEIPISPLSNVYNIFISLLNCTNSTKEACLLTPSLFSVPKSCEITMQSQTKTNGVLDYYDTRNTGDSAIETAFLNLPKGYYDLSVSCAGMKKYQDTLYVVNTNHVTIPIFPDDLGNMGIPSSQEDVLEWLGANIWTIFWALLLGFFAVLGLNLLAEAKESWDRLGLG